MSIVIAQRNDIVKAVWFCNMPEDCCWAVTSTWVRAVRWVWYGSLEQRRWRTRLSRVVRRLKPMTVRHVSGVERSYDERETTEWNAFKHAKCLSNIIYTVCTSLSTTIIHWHSAS